MSKTTIVAVVVAGVVVLVAVRAARARAAAVPIVGAGGGSWNGYFRAVTTEPPGPNDWRSKLGVLRVIGA
jgi:hypothetical protein